LNACYPEHKWVSSRRVVDDRKPIGYWEQVENQRAFFDRLAPALNVQKHEDWYNVHVRTVLDKGGYFINHRYNGSLIKGNLSLIFF
jgi:hypothetical protein